MNVMVMFHVTKYKITYKCIMKCEESKNLSWLLLWLCSWSAALVRLCAWLATSQAPGSGATRIKDARWWGRRSGGWAVAPAQATKPWATTLLWVFFVVYLYLVWVLQFCGWSNVTDFGSRVSNRNHCLLKETKVNMEFIPKSVLFAL
jgi:hypothetical protein